jgi:DUF4097 and DUF4098 domain-containing protein YvlB
MATFDTPAPIHLSVDLPAGDVHVIASDRTDTTVDVSPSRAISKADGLAAEQATVDFTDGRLVVRVPRAPGMFGRDGAVRIRVLLPSGSTLSAEAASADLRVEGPVGDSTVKTASGDVRFEETGSLRVDTSSGDLTVGRSGGDVGVTVQSGDVRFGDITGSAVVRCTSGDVRIGGVAGHLKVNGAKGDVTVDRADGDVTVKISSGDIRIGEVVRGSLLVEASSGDLDVGVREGTAAWLEVTSLSGTVRNQLTESDGPGHSEETVEVRARTVSGDVTVRRARPLQVA